MSQAQEIFSQKPTQTAPKQEKLFSFTEAIGDLKRGIKSPSVVKIFELANMIPPASKQVLIDQIQQTEHVSAAFATKLLQDRPLFERVTKLAQNFSKNGEPLQHLEEVEIYTSLMTPGHDDIRSILETSNPANSFKNLVDTPKDTVVAHRLAEMYYVITRQEGTEYQEELLQSLRNDLAAVGITDFSDPMGVLRTISQDPALLTKVKQQPFIRTLYEAATHGKSIDQIDRRVELYWKKNSQGETIPTLHVHRYAKNPETGYESQMGFDIELENKKRLVKEIIVVTDEDSRGKNEGPEFLLTLLPLIKQYDLQEAEFLANINIGSYVWTKIADVDVPSMAKRLSPAAQAELAHPDADPMRAKALIMRDIIMPEYETRLARAVKLVVDSILNPDEKARIDKQYSDTYLALKEKALSGNITMAELADFGAGEDLSAFDDEGHVVASDDPKARRKGHLGKAAIMGIAWKASIPLNRASLFHIIDKLQKGNSLTQRLSKASKKFGLLFQI